MGLFKKPGSDFWHCRFQVAGREVKLSTRTADRRAAQIEERRLRALHESTAPQRRSPGKLTLAELGGLDCARAKAGGATEHHCDVLEGQWLKICGHFGADSEPRVVTHDSVNDYIIARRKEGALGQTIVREVQALKRGCAIAHRRGAMPIVPQTWPPVKRDGSSKRKGRLHPPQVLSRWLAALPQDARDEAELAALTGLRAAELKRITPAWVEPATSDLATLGVPAMLRVPAEAAKARTERVVPLVAAALQIIHRRVGGAAGRDQPILHQGSHKTAYRLARKRIGYATPISLRDLRHTFGTLANRTVGIDAARDALGHTNVATTNRYVSGDLSRIAEATLAIAALVGPVRSAQASKMLPTGVRTESQIGVGACYNRMNALMQPVDAGVAQLAEHQPSKLSLGVLEHVGACSSCMEHVLACMKVGTDADDVGPGSSAQVDQ